MEMLNCLGAKVESFDDFHGQLFVGRGTRAEWIILENRLSEARCFSEPDRSRDHGGKNVASEMLPDIRDYLTR